MPLAAFPKCFLTDLVTGRMPLQAWVELAATLPIDGLEFYWGFTPRTGDARAALRRLVASRGLQIPMMCYSPDFIQPSRGQMARELAAMADVIAGTAELGGRFCRVLSGQWKPDVARHDGLRLAADAIIASLVHAEAAGVTLVLENHYKDGFWSFPEFAQRMDDFLELLSFIPPHRCFGVNFDPSNALIAGDDPLALLDAVKDRVVTMHASDRFLEGGTIEDLRRQERHPTAGYAPFLRHGVIGKGAIDYDAVFARLRSVNFRGWISIEDGEDPAVGMVHLLESAEFLRLKMHQYNVG